MTHPSQGCPRSRVKRATQSNNGYVMAGRLGFPRCAGEMSEGQRGRASSAITFQSGKT